MKDFDLPQYDNGMAFLDMLFNFVLAFTTLFLITTLLVRPQAENSAAVKMRAEFVLTMTWPDGALDDIDLWLMLPNGKKVNFRDREVEYATLDRDDMGALNDFYTDADGRRQLTKINREMATIRAIVPGRYVVAAHVYAARSRAGDNGLLVDADPKLPYEATLEVVKLNPRLTEVLKSKVMLTERGQEAVFAAFEVDADGKVSDVELNPRKYQITDFVPLRGGEGMP